MRTSTPVLLAAVAAMATVPVAHALERYEGMAYRLTAGTLAYREEHWRYDDAGVASRLVLYRCPDGAAFARKRVRGAAGAVAPDFEFEDARDGYRESVRTRDDSRREIALQARGDAPVQRRLLALGSATVVDAGFDALVRRHWTRLVAATPLSARFLLPARFAEVPVKLQALPRGAAGGGETGFAMRLDAWYGFAVPETRVYYRASDRWLVRFEGIGSIRDARGRNLPVRIEFPERLRGMRVAPAELQRALAAPLDGRCGI